VQIVRIYSTGLRMLRLRVLFIVCIFLSTAGLIAQDATVPLLMKGDTLAFTLIQFEKQFLDSKLQLLSQKYNINENEAYIKQTVIASHQITEVNFIISTGIGSETQKPLAIVVIGGLISATTLTLLVFPLIIHLVYRHSLKDNMPAGHEDEPGIITA
jgi:hypothetical protein